MDNNVFALSNITDAVDTDGFDTRNLIVGANTTGVDTYGKYGVCDFDGSGHDGLFLATGASWWYMSSANRQWTYLNSYTDTLDQVALGDFFGTGVCDVFAVHGNEWMISRGGRQPWQSLGSYGVPFDQLRFGHFADPHRTDIFRRAPDGQWWLISPGNYGWTPIASSSLPLSQLHFGSFNAHHNGLTDVVVNVNGHWSMSEGGRLGWQDLNPQMSDGLDSVLVADLGGTGVDDIVRYKNSADNVGTWEVSIGGRTGWQPLYSQYILDIDGGIYLGHFDGSPGKQLLTISVGDDAKYDLQRTNPTALRVGRIYSRAKGTFTTYGIYAY